MLIEKIPPVLIDAYLEKRMTLFGGAGISIGSGLPSGRRLAFELQNELFRNEHVKVRPSPDDPLQLDVVAQRYQLAFGRQKLNEFLLRTFQKDGLKPNEAHRVAVKLFQRIVTTNFDSLLEDAVKEAGRSPIVVVRDIQIPNTSIPDRTVIYKLHGDLATPDRIVITQRDYHRVPLAEGIKTEFKSLLLKNSMLFVGYGLGDPDFLRLLEVCRGLLGETFPKSYAVMPGAESDPLFVKQCDEDNIDVLSDTAVDFFHDLEEAAKETAVAAPKLLVDVPKIPASEGEVNYRETVREDFKWIDFKGIPVMGGYLRVAINELFVSLSAIEQDELKSEVKEPTRGRESRSPEERASLGLFKTIGDGKKIFDVFDKHRKLVILGDPGSGKTTLLRYVGYHLSLNPPEPAKIGLKDAYIPLFIPLRQFASFLKDNSKGSIESFLSVFMKGQNLGDYLGVVQKALQEGRCMLLLDGLDEVASQDERNSIANQVQQFSTTFQDCRVIVTSRKVGYSRAPVRNGYSHFVVEPLSEEEIQRFIGLWCEATKTEDKEKYSLVEAMKNSRVRALASNPLLITILARVYAAYRNLPERRAQLYSKCVEALLTTWDLVRELPPVFEDAREANRIMGPLALWIHRDHHGQFVTKEQLQQELAGIENLPRNLEPSALLTQIEERSGLLKEVGLDQFAFSHLTFQEYYVAREIVSKGNWYSQLRRYLRNDRWQEIIVLTAGLLDELGQPPVTEFLERFLIKPSIPTKPSPSHIAKLGLLVACLNDKVEPENHIGEYVRKSILFLSEQGDYRRRSTRPLFGRLEGLVKTRTGCVLLEDLKGRIQKPTGDNVVRNSILVGYDLFKVDLEKADFLVFVALHVSLKLPIAASACYQATNLLLGTPASDARNEVVKRIRAMPLERRLEILNLVANFGRGGRHGPGFAEQASEIWMSSDEKNLIPRKRRQTIGESN